MSEVEFVDIFADNLRDIIKESGYSIAELAEESKLDKSTICRYLRKERMPTLKAVINLSMALLCNIDDLIPTYDYID